MNTDRHNAYLSHLDDTLAALASVDPDTAFGVSALTGVPVPTPCREACGREHPHYRSERCARRHEYPAWDDSPYAARDAQS